MPGVAIGQLTIPKLEDYKNKWPVEGTDDYKQNPDNFGLNLIIKKNKKSKYVTAVLFIPLSRHDSRIPDETKEEYCHIFNLDYLTKGDVIFKYWDICRTETNIEKSIRNAIKVYGDNRIK